MDNLLPNNPSNLQSPPASFIVLLMCLLTGYLISGLLIIGLGQAFGFELNKLLLSLNENSPLQDRNLVRIINLISHTLTFTFPALLCTYLTHRSQWLNALRLTQKPKGTNIGLGVLLILISFPFAMYTYQINQQIPLPEWATIIENNAEDMIAGLMVMESPFEFLFSLIIMAVMPAIGEELLFRGVIQDNLEKWMGKGELAVWVTAILFSLFHFQFEGFLPRMLLGALLGYLFFWTRNLWIPIIAHFFFNGMQVVGQYLAKSQMTESEMEQVQEVPWGIGMVSLFLILGIAYFIKKSNPQTS